MLRRKRELTKKQEPLCRFVETYWERNGIAPSLAEIAGGCNLVDRSHARKCVQLIVNKGYLECTPGIPRSLKLTEKWEQLQIRRLDRRTNPAVDVVAENQPELFEGWTEDEWGELRSIRGMGGAMTEEVVVHEAEKINENRQVRRLLDRLLAVNATRDDVISWIEEKHQEIDPRKRIKTRRT